VPGGKPRKGLPKAVLFFLKIKEIQRKMKISGVEWCVHNLSKTVDLLKILTKMKHLKIIVFKAG